MNTLLLKNKSICAIALTALLADALPMYADLKAGDSFPDLANFKLEGKLPDSLKGRIVLLDFWASWCAPCAKSFPAMEELHNRYKDRGVVMLAVSVDEKQSDLEAFLKKHTASFAVVRDSEHKLVASADVKSMPTSFIVDGEGKVRFVHNGFYGEETKKQYIAEIESLSKGKP